MRVIEKVFVVALWSTNDWSGVIAEGGVTGALLGIAGGAVKSFSSGRSAALRRLCGTLL